MQPPFPSVTATWHNASYPAIDPSNPALSLKGKRVVVTGGGAGIGARIAHAFAKAGAEDIAILGRTQKTLNATKNSIESEYKGVNVFAAPCDVTDKAAVDKVLEMMKGHVGALDILVNNVGYLPDIGSVKDANAEEWWKGFEVNVKGSFNVTQAFLKTKSGKATIINCTTGAIYIPNMPGFSSYSTSKLTGTKFFEYVQSEHPEIHVVNVHPGAVETAMGGKAAEAGLKIPIDDSEC